MSDKKWIDKFPDGYIEQLNRPDLTDGEIEENELHRNKRFVEERIEPIFQLIEDFKEYKSGFVIDFNKEHDERFDEYYSPMTSYCLMFEKEYLPWGSYKILNVTSSYDDRLIKL